MCKLCRKPQETVYLPGDRDATAFAEAVAREKRLTTAEAWAAYYGRECAKRMFSPWYGSTCTRERPCPWCIHVRSL